MSVEHQHEHDLFPIPDHLTSTTIPIQSFQQVEHFTLDQLEPIGTVDDPPEKYFIEATQEKTSPPLSSHGDYIQSMNVKPDNPSNDSTRTSMSSIHDTHLDPNELAFRLSRLDSQDISSPPKKTLADELAELGEKQPKFFENDSLDHTPPQEKTHDTRLPSTQSPKATKVDSPIRIDHLIPIVQDIHQIIQDKSVSSLRTIVEDIHAQTNNRNLTKIVDFHHAPPIANLQTIVTELHQIPIGKPVTRPSRPTHLQLEADEEEEPSLSPIPSEEPLSIASNLVNDLEQQLASYKLRSPSPVAKRASDTSSMHATRYHSQRVDKVSDLEIIKQGKGFKIGYVDRQGTDQRVILTKRIEAGPDVMARDPHVRLPYKGRKIMNQLRSSVLYTNGYNAIQEDRKFQHIAEDVEVQIIGTNPQHFDEVCILARQRCSSACTIFREDHTSVRYLIRLHVLFFPS